MATHCKLGDTQSVVTYNFADSANKTVTVKNAPIDVEIKTLPTNSLPGQDPNALYEIIYGDTPESSRRQQGFPYSEGGIGNVRGKITKAVVEYELISGRVYKQNFIVENDKGFTHNVNISPNGEFYGAYVIVRITRMDGKLETFANEIAKCEIKIKHNGILMFSDIGNCPINYSVVCGEECPKGTIKCFSTNYPGYCCLPCASIAAEIKAIASQIRSLNNG